ncbi:site-specific recombinase [Massilia sp. Leaf139]|uniref:site-specific recombinase n=1 Tax=Massilia sp. Leaf139 TaxID=1736272 RepID=UPI0006F99843|nr:site-specific recombinase [Massilia sp. Leaf139]KQQ89011.1 recombinase [Massilia sp. Leaf139]
MLDILERIDPRSDSIDLLVDLVDCMRPRRRHIGHARAAVRTLTQLLRGNPAQAWALRSYIVTLLEKRRHTSLYSDIGILSNDGFFTELKRRVAWRLLPPALDDLYLSDALDQVLYAEEDHRWIRSVPDADWLALFDVVADAPPPEDASPDRARLVTTMGMLDAIRTLSCRVCALGLEPRLVHSYSEIEDFDSPFLMQNIEVNQYLDQYGRYLEGGLARPEDPRHLLVMLDQCEEVVAKIRRNSLSFGTSVALTYVLVAITQSIDRLRKLLFLVDVSESAVGVAPPSLPFLRETSEAAAIVPSENRALVTIPGQEAAQPLSAQRAAALALAQELVEAHNTKYRVLGLFRDNIHLLARNVTENASRTGEHYIAESRAQLRHMFNAAAGAGFIVGFMAMFKILLGYLRAAPLVEAFLFSMNYSLGFMLVHMLRWTIATKQPAMTAQRIAAGLHTPDGRSIDFDRMAELVNKVFRTQIVAVLGNVVVAFPTALVIAVAYQQMMGKHLVSPDKALHLLHDIDPIHTPALFYAAVAGVWLFVAGLISGYYDNKALYTRMGQRVRQLRWLGTLLGTERRARLSHYVENNLGGLMGNFFFGILLGTTGTVGYLVGLPLDIRHVTFSTANFATALVGLDYRMSFEMVANAVLGVALIGAVNLLVSFSLALWVALRARNIQFKRSILLLRALGRRFAYAPIDFFIGPRDADIIDIPEFHKGK